MPDDPVPITIPAPRTIEGWRSLERLAITSQNIFADVRKSNRLYLLSGELSLSRDQGNVFEGDVASGIVRFGIRITYTDRTSSPLYELTLKSASRSNITEKALDLILSQHLNRVMHGSVGGRYLPNAFRVNYIRIPPVEAVIIQGRVQQMACSGVASTA